MTAEDYFESARAAAIEAERTRRTVEGMEAARDSGHADGGTGPVSGGGFDPGKPTASDRLMDYEARMRQRIEEDERQMDDATDVLYGPDDRGGLASLLDSLHADAMWWRYLAACSWVDVAQGASCSVSTAHRLVAESLDYVDGVGIERVRAGVGIAEG